MKNYPDKSILECKLLCDADLECQAFDYGVDPRRDLSGGYKPRACQLQSSADKVGNRSHGFVCFALPVHVARYM